jgi:hypothetical protein
MLERRNGMLGSGLLVGAEVAVGGLELLPVDSVTS